MRVALKALGCRLNEAELESWSNDFRRLGYSLAAKTEAADILVINTCAVTREAVKKSRQLMRKLHRINPQARLVVSGCYASVEPGLGNEIDGIDLLIPNQSKDRLAQIVNDQLLSPIKPNPVTETEIPALFTRGRNRAFIKVQDGCRYQCTFCIVTRARGSERSKQLEDVIDEINALSKHDVREVVLTGVHIGGYGSDSKTNLFTLVKTVLENTDVPRIRLGSVEPWDLGKDFFELFANPRFLPHLHLPLQSGSDTVLRRMARRCKTDDFRRLLEAAHACAADFNVTTDIIAGFPGESDNEWRETLAFTESCGFSQIHIFPYSKRRGTRAAMLPDQVSPEVKKTRIQQLTALARKMRSRVLQKFVGSELPVLFENYSVPARAGKHIYLGYTSNYVRIKIIVNEKLSLKNQIRFVKLTRYEPHTGLMLAELIADSVSG